MSWSQYWQDRTRLILPFTARVVNGSCHLLAIFTSYHVTPPQRPNNLVDNLWQLVWRCDRTWCDSATLQQQGRSVTPYITVSRSTVYSVQCKGCQFQASTYVMKSWSHEVHWIEEGFLVLRELSLNIKCNAQMTQFRSVQCTLLLCYTKVQSSTEI